MAKQEKIEIDEELMRQMIGGRIPDTTSVVIAETPSKEVPLMEPPHESRRRRQSMPDFERTFLRLLDIRYRAAIYISVETKRKVLEVVRKLGDDRMTLTSYVENILLHHLESYKEDINRLHKEQNTKNLL